MWNRSTRFDGLSDTIDYYSWLVEEKHHTLSQEQREDLEGAAEMIVVFGEAGENYYNLAQELLGK